MDSHDASGTLDRNQVRLCYSLVAQRLKIPESELPHVVVIHASTQVAHAADVRMSCVRRNTARDGLTYYEFWIVGRPMPADYVRCMYGVLEQHFNLHISEEDRKQLAAFVLRIISSTASAHGDH